MTIMIKNDPLRSWQDYDLCNNFLDALTKLREICKIVSSRYQTELFTNTGQILRDKWNLRVNHFGEFVKKRQQCQKATRVCKLNSFPDKTQRWKLGNNKTLENEEGVWKSDDLWIFKPKDDDLIYIENTSKAKVLGATSDGKVILEDFEEDKAQQLWKKGNPDEEGYFTLESQILYTLTAISSNSSILKLRGNITL